jgi:hypothetical protein
MRLKCTKKLRSRMEEMPGHVEQDGPIVLGDWVCNIVPIMGGEIIVLLNERTLLTVVLPISALQDLSGSLCQELPALLELLGAPSGFIEAVRGEFKLVSIAPTDSGRLLSLLREVSYYCQDRVDFKPPTRIVNARDLELALAGWLHGPELFQMPIDLLREMMDTFE